jgi:hypothetical protein
VKLDTQLTGNIFPDGGKPSGIISGLTAGQPTGKFFHARRLGNRRESRAYPWRLKNRQWKFEISLTVQQPTGKIKTIHDGLGRQEKFPWWEA